MRQYIKIFNIFNWFNISVIKIISFDLVDLEKDDPGLSGLKNMSVMSLQLEENIDLATTSKYRKVGEDSKLKYNGQGQSEEILE